MASSSTNLPAEQASTLQTLLAYLVHVYTASGVVFAFLAAQELCREQPDARWVFGWLIVAVLIDATDGPLARIWQVKKRAPRIDGRKIDDIVDYLTFTFIPLLLVWRMGWLPEPATAWLAAALIASLMGFANSGAKQEDDGFFLGFPSYWNIYAFYAGLWFTLYGPYVPAVVIAVLTILTVAPVRFIYPNLAPRPWKMPMLVGALVWLLILLFMLPRYPQADAWLVWVSLIYPAFYSAASVYLDLSARRKSGNAA